jgi:hypothetical protein
MVNATVWQGSEQVTWQSFKTRKAAKAWALANLKPGQSIALWDVARNKYLETVK